MRTVGSRSLLLTMRLSCSISRNARMFQGANRRGSGTRGPRGPVDPWKESRHNKIIYEKDRYALTHLPSNGLMIDVPEKPEPLTIPYPKDIVAFLDQFVIGQEMAKKTLAVGVYQHYKRIEFNQRKLEREESAILHAVLNKTNQRKSKRDQLIDEGILTEELKRGKGFNLSRDPEEDVVMDKSNIVLLGPSGSGKTYLTAKLAQALAVPIALCDCTTLTQAGYVGDDVESVIQKLLFNAGGDVAATEKGIVFLDEFDKIYTSSDPAHTGGNRDVNGKGVQQALLKLVEGTKCHVKNPLNPSQKVEVDTSNILFIASGAFAGLDRLVARRLDHRTLGFNSRQEADSNLTEALDSRDEEELARARGRLIQETDSNDLIQFGMVPELVGRFPVLVPFEHLTESQLREVLVKPRNNIIAQAKIQFAADGNELEFTECAITEIAHLAVIKKTGARALRSILEKVLLQARFDCPGSSPCTVVISGAVVRGEMPYQRAISPSRVSASAAEIIDKE